MILETFGSLTSSPVCMDVPHSTSLRLPQDQLGECRSQPFQRLTCWSRSRLARFQ